MAYRRQKLLGRVFDRFGHVIDGLIENGRLVLMIALCFAVAEMISQLREIPAKNDRPVAISEKPISENAISEPAVEDSRWKAFREKSDGRIDTHYQCTFTEFRTRHEDVCRQLEADVAVAMQKNH